MLPQSLPRAHWSSLHHYALASLILVAILMMMLEAVAQSVVVRLIQKMILLLTSDPLLLVSNPFAVRIDWVQEGPKTVCSCEYCKCSCAVYYNTCDTARISHSLLQVSSTHESSGNDPAALAKFVSQQFTIAKLGWDASTAANNTRDMSSEYEEFMNMSMADGIVRSGARSNPLSSVILRGMQNDFGSSTVVTLPSGDKLDTRVITQPPNKHATNNRIPGAAQSGHQGFPTDMSSNLEIDYRYLDERYRSMTQRATSLSSIMFGTDDDAQHRRQRQRQIIIKHCWDE